MLDRIKGLFVSLPKSIKSILNVFVGLVIPVSVFLINYYSEMTFVSSIIGTIFFFISFLSVILIIFILFAWIWYINDLLKAMQYSTLTKAFKAVHYNNDKSSSMQLILNFFLSLIFAIFFCAIVMSYSLSYIYETFIRLMNLL